MQLVEVQLTTQPVRGSEERWDEPGQQPGYQQSEPSENPTVQEYDAR